MNALKLAALAFGASLLMLPTWASQAQEAPAEAEVPADGEAAAEDEASPEVKAARESHGAYLEAQEQQREVSSYWSANLQELRAAGEQEAYNEALKEYREAMARVRSDTNEALNAFLEAFQSAGVDVWDNEADCDLLLLGLYRSALSLASSDLDQAHRYATLLVETYPDAGEVRSCLTWVIPNALIGGGDLDHAAAELERLSEEHEAWAADLHMLRGDVLAMQANFDDAQALYQQAKELKVAANPEDRGLRYLDMRLNLIGKDAPDIESETWLGGEAKPLSDLQGNVVMIDFWATWCGPCISSMPGLISLYDELKLQGVEFLGVTRHYPNGYLPVSRKELEEGERNGESVRDMDEEAFMDHLRDFRRNADVNYPFVVAEATDFSAYSISGIPSMFVVNHEGKITCAIVGGGRKPILKAAIHAAMEAKDAAEE